MARSLILRRNQYFDSVFLMRIARGLAGEAGVAQAAAVMATEANRSTLASLGFDQTALAGAGPNDLVVAIEAAEASTIAGLDAGLDARLAGAAGGAAPASAAEPRTLEQAVDLLPAANVALISVPGEHAAREARAALERGLNAFVFSSNVALDEEITLKREAGKRGLIIMGPDCGTAIIAGVGLGFANAVRRGPIGVIGSSGTGIQELTCLVHHLGSGVSHAIGTGSRDLSDAVGGLSTLAALDALEADPMTRVIALVGKPPGAGALARLLPRLRACARPVVGCFIGSRPDPAGAAVFAATIDEAAFLAVARAAGMPATQPASQQAAQPAAAADGPSAAEAATLLGPHRRWLRGLFAGGTLCYQAQCVLRDSGMIVASNSPLPGMTRLADAGRSVGHTLVDMGSEELTAGRPHPMIDGSLRRDRLRDEAADPEVAMLLLDFVLGAISSPDPVGEVAEAIAAARAASSTPAGAPWVIASVCGTQGDGQDRHGQIRRLRETGALVFDTAAGAALFARDVLRAMQVQGRAAG